MCKVSEEIKNEIMQADEGDGCCDTVDAPGL